MELRYDEAIKLIESAKTNVQSAEKEENFQEVKTSLNEILKIFKNDHAKIIANYGDLDEIRTSISQFEISYLQVDCERDNLLELISLGTQICDLFKKIMKYEDLHKAEKYIEEAVAEFEKELEPNVEFTQKCKAMLINALNYYESLSNNEVEIPGIDNIIQELKDEISKLKLEPSDKDRLANQCSGKGILSKILNLKKRFREGFRAFCGYEKDFVTIKESETNFNLRKGTFSHKSKTQKYPISAKSGDDNEKQVSLSKETAV